jgi:putative ABC transport system permease protein
MRPLQDQLVGGVRRSIWVLQAAVALVLLIACANLANLLLARAETRQREFAVRAALGAGRGRLLRQLITEGVVLSIAGGALGLLLAAMGVRALLREYQTGLPRTSEVAVDPVVLLFAFGISIATGLLFGLAPIMHTRMKRMAAALKDAGAKGATGAMRHRIRHGLVVAQVASTVMLVIGAGLLVRTYYNLWNVDAGFDRSRLVTFFIQLPPVTYPQRPALIRTYRELLDRLRTIPGVRGATAMSGLPPERVINSPDVEIESSPAPIKGNVDYLQGVMTNYFETMGIPIVAGRSFQQTDAALTDGVVVVNETFAKTFLRGRNPIGQRVRPGNGRAPWLTVIGVAKDVKQGGVGQETGTEVYYFAEQTPPMPQSMNVVLRTTLSTAALSRPIENVVHDLDRTIPVVRLRDMDAVFAESLRRPRLLAELVAAFAGLALLLAAIGTYGLLSYVVAEQRREIGIRLALGANRSSVLAQVMKQGLLLSGVGIVVGLTGAWALNQLMASLLFGVQPTDAPTLTASIGTITLMAAVACWLPAWRASRLEPGAVLRYE